MAHSDGSLDWLLTPAPLVLAGCGLVAMILAYVSMRIARKRRYIEDTPTSKAAGVFIGDVELKGRAETTEPLTSYLAEARCVYYTWQVTEHWSRTVVETYRDSKGNMRTRTRIESGWAEVASGGQQIPFYLLDDSGFVLIRPAGMTVEGIEVFGTRCGQRHPLYYGKGPAGSVADSTFERQFTEVAIPLHAAIYVLGCARERTDAVAAEIAHSPDARFSLVTMRTEDSVRSGYASGAWVAGVFGALFAAGGGVAHAALRGLEDGWRLAAAGGAGLAAFLLVLAAIWTLMTFNVLLTLRERVRRGWANIDVELKRRADLIPNLAEAVKGVRGHEAETQRLLALMRAQWTVSPGSARAGTARIEGLAPAVVALSERYPELKASANFLALQDELVRTESRIALARTYYNGIVKAYNARIVVAPDRALAAIGGLRPFAFFEATGLEREAVAVDFAR